MGTKAKRQAIELKTDASGNLEHGWYNDNFSARAISPTQFYYATIYTDGNVSRATRVNGTETTNTASGVKNTFGTAATLGRSSYSSPADNLQGNVAEIIIYHRQLSAAEIGGNEYYLRNKWGL